MNGSKADLRQAVQAQRRALGPADVEARSRSAQSRLMALPAFDAATRVFCYLALPHEVQTGRILAGAPSACVPCFRPASNDYGLCDWSADAALVEGRFGVNEPADPRSVDAGAVDLAVVPGLAFDGGGGRVGHGGGFYDRLLAAIRDARREARRPPALRVGIAFDFQVFDRVPAEAWDIPMDLVLTDERVIECEN